MKTSFSVGHRAGRFVVLRTDEHDDGKLRETLEWQGELAPDDGSDASQEAYELAESECEGYEEGFIEDEQARRAGDDPRYDPPYDPHAEQNELLAQRLDFERHERGE